MDIEDMLGKRRMWQGEGQKAKRVLQKEGGFHITSEVCEGFIPLRTEGCCSCDQPTTVPSWSWGLIKGEGCHKLFDINNSESSRDYK